ncbi:hypothetical protein GALMADRAFT_283974 [Galerina marginata CBS 339.88]|uniref:Uncharacterized protein n=1 Tax=Galerina marginata (strain CBS 339.88) TaxID=685588 RepID=A0A067S655_GALM3|nr:hypothetical protein GALMADRAFT_283974 [Galerina marginata CBS 339.88]
MELSGYDRGFFARGRRLSMSVSVQKYDETCTRAGNGDRSTASDGGGVYAEPRIAACGFVRDDNCSCIKFRMSHKRLDADDDDVEMTKLRLRGLSKSKGRKGVQWDKPERENFTLYCTRIRQLCAADVSPSQLDPVDVVLAPRTTKHVKLSQSATGSPSA